MDPRPPFITYPRKENGKEILKLEKCRLQLWLKASFHWLIFNCRKIIQNKPIPLTYPKEFENGLWGGEALVRGFQKRKQLQRRVPHFWFPSLIKSVLHSEILDKRMEITVTHRTLRLVDQHYVFDSYILEVSLMYTCFFEACFMAICFKPRHPLKIWSPI